MMMKKSAHTAVCLLLIFFILSPGLSAEKIPLKKLSLQISYGVGTIRGGDITALLTD